MAPRIAALLAEVRRRVRRYVCVEGLAAIGAVALIAFWLTLVLDWFFEPPVFVRILMQLAAGCAVAWVGYRLLIDRLRVGLSDRSLALLVERRYSQFKDSLLTAVE